METIKVIADFFVEDVFGGGELVNEEIIKGLQESGKSIEKIRCKEVRIEDLTGKLLIGNFIGLSEDLKVYIADHCDYSIIEHDHKYVKQRDVTSYVDYLVPPNKIINRKFYLRAKYVYCQSKLHSDVVSKNIGLKNVVNLSTSIWSDEHLDVIERSISKKTLSKTMLLNSPNPIKNTKLCIEYCEKNNIEYDLVGPLPYNELMETMAKYETVLFLPGVLETYNKFIVEARMLGCKVITDNRNGCSSENWFSKLKGIELLDFIRASKQSFIDNFIYEPKLYKPSFPLVSVITSMFNPGENLKPFLDNIISQSCFRNCELIIIDAGSTDSDKSIIKEYQQKYSNIIYDAVQEDPGIYGCWNEAIKLSSGKYITNANLDDRRADTHIEHHVRFLEDNPGFDLAYSEAYVTNKPFEDYYNNSSNGMVYPIKDFSKVNMVKCLPSCMPVWRSSVHEKELFDGEYTSAGDWEMWLRMVKNGSTFHKLSGVYGLYYMNPNGLSTSESNRKKRLEEESKVFKTYKNLWE
tara:strand:+ start:18916 stop:20478 length:1563 start_codon:yes stop_codon:yes gene_type:complete